MPASGRQTNWIDVTIGTNDFTRVKEVQVDWGGKDLQSGADADFFNTLGLAIGASPRMTVNTEGPSVQSTIPVGTKGTFTATHKDSENADGTGDLTYTLVRAYVANHQSAGQFQQVGTLNTVIGSSSADGATSPLSITIGTGSG